MCGCEDQSYRFAGSHCGGPTRKYDDFTSNHDGWLPSLIADFKFLGFFEMWTRTAFRSGKGQRVGHVVRRTDKVWMVDGG